MKRYEQAIRVITAFFAFLLGFGLKRLLDHDMFTPPSAQWPCFFLSVFLFLRLLLGSGNHMWYEFVRPDLKQECEFSAPRLQVLNDFLFLVVFGLIGVSMCYTDRLDRFLILNMLLTGIGFTWVLIYRAVSSIRQSSGKTAVPQGKWGYWGMVNFLQFVLVAMVWWFGPNALGTVSARLWIFPGPAWDWALLILVAAYLALFIYDFLRQLKILEDSPNPIRDPNAVENTSTANAAPAAPSAQRVTGTDAL